MDSDLDPFADLLPEQAVNNVRVAGKFQPRAKLRPGKVNSKSLSRNTKKESRSSLQSPTDVVESVRPVDTVCDRLTSTSVSSSTVTCNEEILGNNRGSMKNEPVNSSTQVVAGIDDLDSSIADSQKVAFSQPDLHSFSVPNSSISEDNRSKEPTSSSLGTLSVAQEHGNDNEGLCLHELDTTDAVDLNNGASNSNCGWSSSFMASTKDVGSLEIELDPFADTILLPAVDNARAGGKFKPKAKVQLRKKASQEVPATVDNAVSANQSAEYVDVRSDEQTNPTDPSVTTSENLVTKEPLGNEDYSTSGVTLSADSHSCFEKPTGENGDIYLGLDYFHDLVTQSPNNIEIPVPTSNDEETGQHGRYPTQNSGNFPVRRACNKGVPDPVSCNDSVDRTEDGRLQSEEQGPFYNVEVPNFLPDSDTVYELCSRKFQPKPTVQNGKKKPTATNVAQDSFGCGNEGILPDYSSMSFSDFIPRGATTAELPTDEEQTNTVEASQSFDANNAYQEYLHGVPENKSSRSNNKKPSAVSNPPHKSSMQLRKRTAAARIIEENEDENEAPSTSVADGDNDYDYRVHEDTYDKDRSDVTSKKKGASKKPPVPASKRQNTGKGRKRENDAQEHSTQVPKKKKFSHSTRRKNRLKELLTIPEEEVDFQRLPFRDIILLAEHKENLAAKETKASKKASTDQSSKNSAKGKEPVNEEDTSEHDDEYIEDQSNLLFNHNSFMDRTPKSRWSKQDTELFYEGIRQFGTDLSMIQQLFPGKTRNQIKLKYKREERQYPLRLHEALGSRCKDNSYFEKVIEQLKLVAPKAEHESNTDAPAGASDEDTELNPDTHEDNTEKMEHNEDIIAEEGEGNAAVESPMYDEQEDDMDVYNSYVY